MTTYGCDTNPDEEAREEPTELAQTLMVGKWTYHSYRKSPDGKTLLYHLSDGIKIQQGDKVVEYKMHLLHHNPRGFYFSPDSKSVAFWAPYEEGQAHKRIALMDLGSLSSSPKFSVVYVPPKGHVPFGMEWGPGGKSLFVVEKTVKDDTAYAILKGLDMPGGGKGRELFRTAGKIDFFMPPVSRFAGGKGPSKEPYKIIFGCENGLYLINPKNGNDRQRLSRLPAVGLHNIEWNPDENKNQIALFFKNSVSAADGRRFEGVYLLDIDKLNEATARATGQIDEKSFLEQIHRRRDIHTLWFSPKGQYVSWASQESIFFRRPEDPAEKTALIEILDRDENARRIKGVAWNEDESKIAFAADSQVWVYDFDPPEKLLKKQDAKVKKAYEEAVALAKKEGNEPPPEPEPDPVDASIEAVTGKRPYRYMIKEFARGFTAEPQWIGERVVLSLFEEAREPLKMLCRTPAFPAFEPKVMLGGSMTPPLRAALAQATPASTPVSDPLPAGVRGELTLPQAPFMWLFGLAAVSWFALIFWVVGAGGLETPAKDGR
ncbi:MAG: hypothetical protein JKY65_20205 [Planctomycetes bacterium]|nr:hypothetical protein [Planctomycetota bacterium]